MFGLIDALFGGMEAVQRQRLERERLEKEHADHLADALAYARNLHDDIEDRMRNANVIDVEARWVDDDKPPLALTSDRGVTPTR